MPVYFFTEAEGIGRVWPLVALATAGVLIGTVVGERVLQRVPEGEYYAGWQERTWDLHAAASGVAIDAKEKQRFLGRGS